MGYEVLGFLMIPFLYGIDLWLYNKIHGTTKGYLQEWKIYLNRLR